MNMHAASGVTGFWGGVGAQKSMLNNGITSVTCIHREAGIKTRRKKGESRKGRRREGRKDIDESEAIKNQSTAYLLEK